MARMLSSFWPICLPKVRAARSVWPGVAMEGLAWSSRSPSGVSFWPVATAKARWKAALRLA